MKTFKEYMGENAKGNYVCIDVQTKLNSFFASNGLQDPVSGTRPPNNDYHCTLIYSKETCKDPQQIMRNINKYFDPSCTATIEGFDCFDSLPERGARDKAKSCIVMKLKCDILYNIHEYLKSIGLVHSYPKFSPHVTLQYNMSVEEAHYYKDKLNLLKNKQIISLTNYKSQAIDKDYV